jgi:hypothetical protein
MLALLLRLRALVGVWYSQEEAGAVTSPAVVALYTFLVDTEMRKVVRFVSPVAQLVLLSEGALLSHQVPVMCRAADPLLSALLLQKLTTLLPVT